MKYLLLLLHLLVSTVFAESSGETTSGVSCRVICLAYAEGGPVLLYAKPSGGEPCVDIELTAFSSAKRFSLIPTKKQIGFYVHPLVDGQSPSGLAAVATIPAGAKDVLIYLIPSPGKSPIFYEAVVFDLDAKSFPEGGCMVLNINDSMVRFVIGEHQLMLGPGKRVAVARPTRRDKYNMSDVAFQFQKDRGWKTAYESTVRFPEGQRKVFITYIDPKTKRPRAHSYNFSS